MSLRLVCIGERRSTRARCLGASWTTGGLGARTLHAALRAIGVDPGAVVFLNLFREGDGARCLDPVALSEVRRLAAEGATIVGLGRIVQAALRQAGVEHLALIHPAARGRVRARAVYQAHVATVLGGVQRQPGEVLAGDGCTSPSREPSPVPAWGSMERTAHAPR